MTLSLSTRLATLALLLLTLVGCGALQGGPLQKRYYGTTMDDTEVDQFTLTNAKGSTASFITYGATITNLKVPDKDGKLGEVVLGYDSLRQYEFSGPSMGCVVGRFANRIANASFSFNDNNYGLSANQGPNTLHGGFKGLQKRVWKGEASVTPDGPAVRFSILDPDGAEGFPGNLNVSVIYTLTGDDTLKIQILATTDKATPVNFASHAFYNLGGDGKTDSNGYVAKIYATRYLPMDAGLIPTGKIDPVAGTPLDFTKAKVIGRDIASLPWTPPGYDHTFVLDNTSGKYAKAAEVYDPASGRLMECWTTEPAVHFTNARNWKLVGRNGQAYGNYWAVCLETQHFSDSPNHPEFPTTILRPGQVYRQLSAFKFSVPTKPLQPE